MDHDATLCRDFRGSGLLTDAAEEYVMTWDTAQDYEALATASLEGE